MSKTSQTKIESELDEYLELCGSTDLYNKEIERLCTKFSEEDKKKILGYAKRLLDESNNKQEAYRTGIANLNFSIFAVLQKLSQNLITPTATSDIYKIDMSNAAKDIESHLIYMETIKKKKRKELSEERRVLEKSNGDPKKIKTLSQTIESLKPKKIKPKDVIFSDNAPSSRSKESSISKAIRFLVAYNVIKYVSPNAYILNMKHWFNFQRYSLNNKELLEHILPLLASFLKFNAPYKVDDFLKHIDKIVGYTLKAPQNHALFANIENYIIRLLKEGEDPTISFKIIHDKTNSKLDNKTIFTDVDELQIIFNELGTKLLKFRDTKDYEVAIEDIELLKVPSKTINSIHSKQEKSFVIYNDMYEHDDPKYTARKNKAEENGDTHYSKNEYEVIFSADSNMNDFFNMDVLRNTKLFQQEDEKEKFISEELNQILNSDKTIDDYKNKVLIKGSGNIDDILSYAQMNGHVKILHPPFLINKLKEILDTYSHMYNRV